MSREDLETLNLKCAWIVRKDSPNRLIGSVSRDRAELFASKEHENAWRNRDQMKFLDGSLRQKILKRRTRRAGEPRLVRVKAPLNRVFWQATFTEAPFPPPVPFEPPGLFAKKSQVAEFLSTHGLMTINPDQYRTV